MLSWVQTLAASSAAASLFVAPAAPAEPAPAEAVAAPSEPDEPPPPSGKEQTIAAAEEAWNGGDFLEVRSLLEPIADNDPLEDRVERERVLVLLADATLSDGTLPSDERQVRATGHLTRMMDNNPTWRLPRKVYSPELYDLYLNVREQRIANAGSRCEADKLACIADVDEVGTTLAKREEELDDLQKKYDSQEVAIGEKRTRALALFPLGVSHFLNGDRGIGAAFLATEAVVGIAGLSLLAIRATVDGCDRKDGFQSGSLVCNPRGNTTEDDVVRRRRAEEAMAWVFVVTVVADIVVAQLRFKEFEITDSVPRSELESEGRGRRRRRKKRRASVSPEAGASSTGASLGLRVRF
jgi:hypothetical protein